jgi:hypothetical protein
MCKSAKKRVICVSNCGKNPQKSASICKNPCHLRVKIGINEKNLLLIYSILKNIFKKNLFIKKTCLPLHPLLKKSSSLKRR